MKKFSFELQKVLDFRNFEKEQAEAELAKALAVETDINNKLAQIAQQYALTKAQMKGSLNIEDVLSQSQFNKLLEYQKEELLKQLAQAKIVSEQKRDVLRECMKKTTALEKMRDQQLEEWTSAANYEESEFIDELSTTSSGRRFPQ